MISLRRYPRLTAVQHGALDAIARSRAHRDALLWTLLGAM